MKKNYTYFLLLFLCSLTTYSQAIKGKVIDATTSEIMENVAIQADEKTGVFSDENGMFSIEMNGNNFLTFSCIGYQTRTISIKQMKVNNFVIKLTEIENVLDEVIINSKKLTLEEVLLKVQENLPNNYKKETIKQQVFIRMSNSPKFKRIDLELDKNSVLTRKQRKKANESFIAFSNKVKNTSSTFYSDYFTNFYSTYKYFPKAKRSMLSTKATDCKGIKIVSDEYEYSIEKIQEEIQQLILKQLDTTAVYKVKSGLFKVEDNLSIKKVTNEIEKQKDSFNVKSIKHSIYAGITAINFTKTNAYTNFLNQKYYKHDLVKLAFVGGEMNYILKFSSKKSKTKFRGYIYVNANDFGITRVDYEYDKGKKGQHANLKLLLGVKFSENLKRGTIVYQKKTTNTYYPIYIKEEIGTYFYVNRPFKFIEKSSKKNKVKFSFKLEGNFYAKKELVISNTEIIDKKVFEKITDSKMTPYTSTEEYFKSSWGNGKLLLPFKSKN